MKKIGLIALALVLSLGLLGVGLAQWTETLTINGSVATGDLSVAFSGASCSDNETAPDVGTCSADIDATDPDNEKLVITISNAYPCYTCTVYFTVVNDGSIPVDLGALSLSAIPTELDVTVSGAAASATEDLAVNGTVSGTITIHVKDTAAELTTYSFSATILAEQFNT